MKNILAFDIGGTKVKYGIVNTAGKVLKKDTFDTDCSSEEAFLKPILDIINKEKEIQELEGVGISMPGFIDAEKGIPTVCYAIKCMEGKSITDIIALKTGFKASVENDGNCAAFAEKFNGNALNCSDFICVTIGTGIGGGIYLNDRIVRGNSFRAGEFGFMVCEGLNKEKIEDSIISANASTRSLVLDYMKYKNMDPKDIVEGYEVFEKAKEDQNVREIINNWYRKIALGVVNLSATLNPEKILIGGGVSAREDFIKEIERCANEITWWKDVSSKIEVCKHRNDAGLIGAAYNFIIESLNR